MKWIYRLERKLGRSFGIPNLMIYITATMVAVYVLGYFFIDRLIGYLTLNWHYVMQGQIWRLITFIFIPPTWGNLLLLLLALYAAYHIGSSLEYEWGPMLFTLYYVMGVVGAILASIVTYYALGGPDSVAAVYATGSNYYIYLSMFLAYAYLYPDATFMLFFILPVKAKWLAILDWALYIFAFVFGSITDRVAAVFSLINFFVFFGPDVWKTVKQNYKTGKRRREYRKNWGKDNPWR